MIATPSDTAVSSLEIRDHRQIAAPPEIAFEALLAELGPDCTMAGDVEFPMQFEAWPGGRWFRDLGNGAGHFWGHVQVIKPPTLLEISGPLFMSYPAVNFVQYRLKAHEGGTRLELSHRAIGLIVDEHRQNVNMGWTHILDRIRSLAEARKS